MKDFIFFNYDWVPNSTYIFRSFEAAGYSCDFVNEQNLMDVRFTKEKYRCVVVYLHEPWQLPHINSLISRYWPDAFLIQHDDTDEEQVQKWLYRSPDLIMQREVTHRTVNPYSCPLYPQHFPIADIHRPELSREKTIDVCFIGTPSNPRRESFVRRLQELSQGSLKHLNWGLMYGRGKNPALNIAAINQSKIGLNFPGNSYDSWRIWELASAGVATIMPELPLKSVTAKHQPYDEYTRIELDGSDLEEKIVWMLENDRWEQHGARNRESYLKYHTPEKCFEHYHDCVIMHAPIQPRIPADLSAEPFFEAWRRRPV
jgi:hypothetical protein